jgi:transketolase C-terminal domain/subunit
MLLPAKPPVHLAPETSPVAYDDETVLKALPNIKIYKPNSIEELETIWPEYINSNEPAYLNLTRKV